MCGEVGSLPHTALIAANARWLSRRRRRPRTHYSRSPPGTIAAVAALHALRASLTNVPDSWSAGDDPCGGQATCGGQYAGARCAWAGVACAGWRVTDIVLPCRSPFRCYNLGGTLPGALAGASELRSIVLQGNDIGAPLRGREKGVRGAPRRALPRLPPHSCSADRPAHAARADRAAALPARPRRRPAALGVGRAAPAGGALPGRQPAAGRAAAGLGLHAEPGEAGPGVQRPG